MILCHFPWLFVYKVFNNIAICSFLFRWTPGYSKENIHKMDKLPLDKNAVLARQRSVCRLKGRPSLVSVIRRSDEYTNGKLNGPLLINFPMIYLSMSFRFVVLSLQHLVSCDSRTLYNHSLLLFIVCVLQIRCVQFII